MTVRVFALNAKTFDITAELPVTSVRVTPVLNGIGSWEAELPSSVLSPNGAELLTEDSFDTNKTVVAITYDGLVLMMGLFLQELGSFDENTDTLKIGGPELSLGYMHSRHWIDPPTSYAAEIFTIAAALVAKTDFLGLGELIEVSYEPSPTVGIAVATKFERGQRKTLYEMLDDFSNAWAEFDYMAYATGSQETGFKTGVLFGWPQILRRTGYVLELGKNIKKLSYAKDGRNYANLVTVAGEKRGPYQAVGTAVDGPGLNAYPYFMRQESFADIKAQAQLQAVANKILLTSKKPPRAFEVTIDQRDPDCVIGNWRLGDEFRMVAKKGRLDVDSFFRVSSWSLSVSSDGAEEVKMTLFETGTM